jgi:nicotinamidase-related amidase
MPLTALDPSTALIVIDLQKGLGNGSFIHPIGDIIDRTRALIDAFREKNLPVVLVNVAGRAPGRTEQGPRNGKPFVEGWTDLLPQLDQQPSDIVVTKRSWGAFATTDLERQLKARGVTQVVVTGVVTSGGGRASASLPRLDDVTASPASRRLASARPALAPKCITYSVAGP